MLRLPIAHTIKFVSLFKLFSPSLVWYKSRERKIVYLTFDDGPVEGVTDWVLKVLEQYNIKATFFCIGKCVVENEHLFQEIIKKGHSVGNHTYSHVNGFKTKSLDYIEEVNKTSKIVKSNLFRPPYGLITTRQIKALKTEFKIIMWDVISGDYDITISPHKCIHNVLENVKNGSIIVMHDSQKAEFNLKESLVPIIINLKKKGFHFETL